MLICVYIRPKIYRIPPNSWKILFWEKSYWRSHNNATSVKLSSNAINSLIGGQTKKQVLINDIYLYGSRYILEIITNADGGPVTPPCESYITIHLVLHFEFHQGDLRVKFTRREQGEKWGAVSTFQCQRMCKEDIIAGNFIFQSCMTGSSTIILFGLPSPAGYFSLYSSSSFLFLYLYLLFNREFCCFGTDFLSRLVQSNLYGLYSIYIMYWYNIFNKYKICYLN